MPITPPAAIALFGETASRVVVTTAPDRLDALQSLAAEHEVPLRRLGAVAAAPRLHVEAAGESILDEDVNVLYDIWSGALARAMEQH